MKKLFHGFFLPVVAVCVLGLALFSCSSTSKESSSSSGLSKKMERCIRVPTIKGATYVGSDTCSDCHDEVAEKMKDNVHMRLAKFEAPGQAKGCEGCHGPGSKHVDEEDPAYIITFKNLNSFQASDACLKCHSDAETLHWGGSKHAMVGLSCMSCHDVHNGKGEYMLKAKTPDLCANCHKDIWSKTFLPEHHPIREGKVDCTDCHNPHGSEVKPMLRTVKRLNDVCYECHQDKEGPFLFEHEPVSERCTICHDPHGTVADNMLKQNEPFICLQCHEFHFHAELPSNSGTPQVGMGAGSMTRAFTTRCTICHYQIHGSDEPSQSLGGHGKAFTR